jgi:hypothetical protein
MDWSIPPSDTSATSIQKEIKKGMSGEGVGLVVVSSLLFLSLIVFLVLYKMRKVECVIPEKTPDAGKKDEEGDIEMPHVNKIKSIARIKALRGGRGRGGIRARSPRTIEKPPVNGGDDVDITPEMLAKGSRRQMRIKRHEKEKRHSHVQDLKNDMLPMGGHDMHLDHPDGKRTADDWTNRINHHHSINRHPSRGRPGRFNANPKLAQKTKD